MLFFNFCIKILDINVDFKENIDFKLATSFY